MQKWLCKYIAEKSIEVVKSRHPEVPEQQIAKNRVCSQKAAQSTCPGQLAAASASSTRRVIQDCCGKSSAISGTVGSIPSYFSYLKPFCKVAALWGEGKTNSSHLKSPQMLPLTALAIPEHLCPFSYLHCVMAGHYSSPAHTHTHRHALTLHTITSVQVMHSNRYSENQCHSIPTQTVQDQSTPISYLSRA